MATAKTIKLTKKEVESLKETANILAELSEECVEFTGVDIFQFRHSCFNYENFDEAVDTINIVLEKAIEEG